MRSARPLLNAPSSKCTNLPIDSTTILRTQLLYTPNTAVRLAGYHSPQELRSYLRPPLPKHCRCPPQIVSLYSGPWPINNPIPQQVTTPGPTRHEDNLILPQPPAPRPTTRRHPAQDDTRTADMQITSQYSRLTPPGNRTRR